MELSLRESELRYRRLFEAAQDGILILDAKTGMIEDVNPYLVKMLGYSREEFVEKKLWEVGVFSDTNASMGAFEVLQDREFIRYENLPLKTKAGRMIEVEFVSNVYLAGSEKVIQCNIRDITEHKRIITALQANEKKYHELLNQSSDGIFIIDLTGNILTVNSAMCRELEFSEEEFLSMKIWEVIPEQYLHEYRERLTKILAGEIFEKPGEYEVRGKDGRNHYVEILSTPHYYGQDIVGFQGIAHDITARKQAEEALQESEAKFRRLVVHLPTVVYLNAVGDASSTLYISPQIETLMGYTPQEWLADPKLWTKTLHPEDRQQVLAQTARTDQSNEPFDMEYRMIARDGRLVWVHDEVILVNDLDGKPRFWQGIMLDITERKHAEEELRESEEKYRMIVETSAEGMWVVDDAWKTTYVNPAMAEMLGYTADEILGRSPQEFVDGEEVPKISLMMKRREKGITEKTEVGMRRKDGTLMWTYGTSVSILDDKGEFVGGLSLVADITERKQAEKALYESEERFRNAFQYSAIGMALVSLNGNWLKVNSMLCSIVGYSEDELLTKTFQDITHPEDLHRDLTYLKQLLAGEIKSYKMEKRYFHLDGQVVWVLLAVALARDNEGTPLYLIAQMEDITERKLAENAVREVEERFRQVWEATSDAMALSNPEGITLAVNPAYLDLYGYSLEQVIGRSFAIIFPEENRVQALEQYKTIFASEAAPPTFETAIRRMDGTERIVEARAAFLTMNGQRAAMLSTIHDITERKHAEEGLRESERLLSEAQRIGHMGSWGYEILTDTLQYSDEMYRLLDVSPEEFQHNQAGFLGLIYASDRPLVMQWMKGIKAGREVKELDFRLFRKNGELCYIQNRGAVIFDSAGNPARFIGTAQDVSERKLAEIQIHQQIQRLTALTKIDQEIISTVDLDTLMETVLPQVVAQLQVDAADVLLLPTNSEMLDFVAGQGFRTQAAEAAKVPISDSVAGRAVKERRLIKIENLQEQPGNSRLSDRLAGEGFASYFGVPLIAKGQVKGVLEVFHRTPLYPYAEWIDFLNALGGQVAVAIENAALFTNLEQSNRELSQAYDVTIEGWSRALDLRDKETEGHTLRVTELALSLARNFNFTDIQTLYIRWGGLLHDIGKMGIPDSILLKPDTLSKEEWVIMRKHPQYAYDLLQPIAFLTPALDIPYCHHEKWDGTGYPRGLKGEEIPLQARIFAVVDVWDALLADRPYRPRWPEGKVRDHIRTLSGTHFDPQVVDAFLQIPQ